MDGAGLKVAARVALAWTDLEARIRERQAGATFEGAAGTLVVEDVALYPSGDRVALGLSLRAASMGAAETDTTDTLLPRMKDRKRAKGPVLSWSGFEWVGLRTTDEALVVDVRLVGSATHVVSELRR